MARGTMEERFAAYLEFLQWVVDCLGLDLKIEKPEDFEQIERGKLLSIDFLGEKHDEWKPMLDVYNQTDYVYHERNRGDAYIVTVIRYLSKHHGYQVKGKRVRKLSNKMIIDHYYYKIIPK